MKFDEFEELCTNCMELFNSLELEQITTDNGVIQLCPDCYEDYLETIKEDKRTQSEYEFDKAFNGE